MKRATALLAGASLVGLSLFAAAPAHAAGNDIDPGDSLYALNCDWVYNDWQLLSVDPKTAFSTLVGSGSGSVDESLEACAGQAAYNPATGKSYYIQWYYDGEVWVADLAEIDVATGLSTTIGGFYYNNGEFPEYIDADALAIGGDGSAYMLGEGYLWEVDLETALVTPVGESLVDTYAFAWDSKTGGFYAIDDDNELFQVDETDGTFVSLGDILFPSNDNWVYSLQFDEAGTLWIEVDGWEGERFLALLFSLTFDTLGSPVLSGEFIDDPYYTESLLIIPGTPAPALAATGIDVTPVAGGAAALLLLGAASVFAVRRRTA